MFVNRSGLNSSAEKTVSQVPSTEPQAAQKRAAVIGLAVAATVSVLSVTWSRLQAQESAIDDGAVRPLSLQAEAVASDLDLLKQSINQFRKGQYEDAKASLAQVNAANLSESDQRRLASATKDVDAALQARQDARARFSEGQAALESGDSATARRLFKDAGDSRYADDATRQKAREQLSLVGEMEKQTASEQRAEYQQAKKDLEAGNLASARARFEKLDQAGYKAPTFQTSPRDFLKQIDQKVAAGAAEGVAAPAPQAAATDAKAAEEQARIAAEAKAKEEREAAASAASAARDQAKQSYAAGLVALKAGDYATARANFKAADEAGFKPGMFQDSAAEMLAEVDQAEAAAAGQAPVAEVPAPAAAPAPVAAPAVTATPVAPVPVAEAAKTEEEAEAAAKIAEAERKAAEAKARADQKVAEEQATADRKIAQEQARAEAKAAEEAAKAQRVKARQSYVAGVAALKAGDYAGARTNFTAADEAGYKPGLFEASAAKMLAEVDEKESQAGVRAAEAPAPDVAAPAVAAPAEQATDQAKIDADRKAAEAQAKADEETAKAQAKADREAAEAQAKADAEAVKARARADKEAVATRQVAAREQYKAGIAALKAGDYTVARQSFQAADEAGFKPGLFEATAAKMVAEVDAKENEGKIKAERLAAIDAAKAEDLRAQTGQPAVEGTVGTAQVTGTAQETSTDQSDLEATAKMEQIRQQARLYESQRLVEQARAAQQEGRNATALELYSRAVETDPSNQAAVEGRNQTLTLQGRAPIAGTLLDDQSKINRARKEQITYSFNEAIDRTRASIASENYSAAQLQLEQAVVARQQDPALFSPDELRAFDTTIAQTQLDVREGREAFERSERQRIADEATRREQERRRLEDVERRSTVAALIKDARRYIQQNKYREALATIDQVIAIDSTNEYATGVRPLVEDRALLQEQREHQTAFNLNYRRQMNDAIEVKIPYGDIYRYPTNWPEISDNRDRFVEQERGLKQADKAVRAALEKRLPEVRIDGQPFDDVVQFLRDMTGANIFVKWSSLEQAAIDRKTPVSVQLRDVKFAKVLQTILDSVSSDPNTRLAYTVNEGVITIYVTQDVTGAGAVDLVTRVYDITDLMFVIPDLEPSDTGGGGGGGGTGGGGGGGFGGGGDSGGGGSSRSGGGGGGSSRSGGGGGGSSRSSGGGGGGGGLFGGGGGGGGTGGGGGGGSEANVADRMEDVRTLIAETVAIDTWDDVGGPGSIRPSPLNQQLIISQSPEVHAQIEALLAQLRESTAIQVTVETRFLTVARNFLEDIGMDFNFSWNTESGPGSKFSPIQVTQNSSAFTANPSTGIPGGIAVGSPSATLTGSYLDDFQVSFLIRATQANVSQSVVTAPRVTVYNGGSAQVWIYTNQPYVANLEPEVASGVVGYTADIQEALDGVTLFVRANVSADRKYVTLYLLPTLERILGFSNFAFQQASTLPSNVVGGSAIFTSQPTLSLQLPLTQEIGVETLVSVPDGGTLLLGGQTVAGEIERESGVPVLSKIPLLKRFFTNRSSAKDESVLLILVKPTIIIQREQEARQFPLLTSKISGQ